MEPLPSKKHVLRAFRAKPSEEHPVLQSAHTLGELHVRRLRTEADATGDIDQRRVHLVLGIDRWVATELPPAHGGAHMHTESVGMVIDRLAQFSARAFASLVSEPDWVVHDDWERLAELALGYQDLALEVSAGIRRLPYLGGPCR
ncbi:DUF4254 domain-containing protein [Nocardia amikacinitolerans]|uniref:DUF4254 domain-containing protein n=1 Tax=Nocardia amikacinitolerans TaxID=756689 RepID=UPI0020A26D0A|nr:DUF4254 domain-containing protein [Nocardia amikacinitolerans]MCP2290265.1 Protein of unknown function (DUF4254) [Nocardia amikacinitolerans]